MNWNLWICFVGINIALIQALRTFNNVDSKRLSNYLHRKYYQNPLSRVSLRNKSPRKNYNVIGKNHYGEPIYALVDMTYVKGRKPRPTIRRPTYHGNGRWGYLRDGRAYASKPKISYSDKSREAEGKKSAKRTLVSYEEMNSHVNDPIQYDDSKKVNPGLLQLNSQNLESAGQLPDTKVNSGKTLLKLTSKNYESNGKLPDMKVNLGESLQQLSSQNLESTGQLPDTKVNPGVSLLQLSSKNLESAGKFPDTEKSSLVYGNLDNLGITYGQSKERLFYSNFRKSNDVVDLLNTAVPKSSSGPRKWIVVEITPRKTRIPFLEKIKSTPKDEEENNASEILDEVEDGDSEDEGTSYRRHKKTSKFRKRENYGSDWKDDKESTSVESPESSSDGSSHEKNPGNPYSLFGGKYRQNWMWNHNMDGDHMNINPYGPLFNDMTANGQDILFARKWWYFNQDDYKPMG